MKTLLVEDDEDKRQQLAAFIKGQLSSDVIEARSLQSGLKALIANDYDLIVLDMSMTTFDISPAENENGGRPQPFGGREILLQMKRRRIATRAVVVTQYDKFGQGDEETSLDELDRQLHEAFPNTYIGAVAYNVGFTGWQDQLLNLLQEHQVIS